MSRLLFAAAALAVATSPTLAATPSKPAPATAKVDQKTAPTKVDPAQAFAAMTKMLDKFFPAGPEPDPTRLAAARDVTMTMFPKGAYAEAMNGFVDGMADRVLNMSEADFKELMPAAKLKKGEKAPPPPSTEPMRVMLTKKDPMFDAKLAAGKAFAKTMFVKFGDVMEPKFREGMARSMARKFDAQQMAEIRTFLATPIGAAYGRQMVGLWFEPDVLRGTFQAFPEMLKLMPDMMKDASVLDEQMKGKKSDAK